MHLKIVTVQFSKYICEPMRVCIGGWVYVLCVCVVCITLQMTYPNANNAYIAESNRMIDRYVDSV